MRIKDLDRSEFARRLKGPGVVVRTGPFTYRLQVTVDSVARLLHLLYADYALSGPETLCDARLRVARRGGIRGWWGPQIHCLVDAEQVFEPMPLDQAYPALEWGMNWCVATRSHGHLMLHSTVIERGGGAVLLPAWSGSGKTTLCAGLIHRGWRYFSDEFAMIRLEDGAIDPLPRPLPLKNESIPLLRRFAPDAVFGPVIHTQRKGDIAHLKPPAASVARAHEPAPPTTVVFPKYAPGEPARLEPMPKGRAFLKMAGNSFNFQVLGSEAFDRLAHLVDTCDCHVFVYGDLDDAVGVFDDLAGGRRGA